MFLSYLDIMKLPAAHAAQAPALRELRGIKAESRRSHSSVEMI